VPAGRTSISAAELVQSLQRCASRFDAMTVHLARQRTSRPIILCELSELFGFVDHFENAATVVRLSLRRCGIRQWSGWTRASSRSPHLWTRDHRRRGHQRVAQTVSTFLQGFGFIRSVRIPPRARLTAPATPRYRCLLVGAGRSGRSTRAGTASPCMASRISHPLTTDFQLGLRTGLSSCTSANPVRVWASRSMKALRSTAHCEKKKKDRRKRARRPVESRPTVERTGLSQPGSTLGQSPRFRQTFAAFERANHANKYDSLLRWPMGMPCSIRRLDPG